MYCYIKEWPDKMATLMTVDGVVLCKFESTIEAKKVWQDWNRRQKTMQYSSKFSEQQGREEIESEVEILRYSPTISQRLKAFVAICSIGKN